MKRMTLFLGVLLNTTLLNAATTAPAEFPGRAKYPEVKVVEKSQLMNKMLEVVIIDARSPLKFKTLRMGKGAKGYYASLMKEMGISTNSLK